MRAMKMTAIEIATYNVICSIMSVFSAWIMVVIPRRRAPIMTLKRSPSPSFIGSSGRNHQYQPYNTIMHRRSSSLHVMYSLILEIPS